MDRSWFLVEGPDFYSSTADFSCSGRVIVTAGVRATGEWREQREELSPWLGRRVSGTWGVGY